MGPGTLQNLEGGGGWSLKSGYPCGATHQGAGLRVPRGEVRVVHAARGRRDVPVAGPQASAGQRHDERFGVGERMGLREVQVQRHAGLRWERQEAHDVQLRLWRWKSKGRVYVVRQMCLSTKHPRTT